MASSAGAPVAPLGANLNTLPLETLAQILDELVVEDVARRSDRMFDEIRLNSNLTSLVPLFRTSRRLSFLARERFYERVRLSSFERIQQFAETVTDQQVAVKDLGIDASQYGNMPRDKNGPIAIPLSPFLHALGSLQSLSLNSFYGQEVLRQMLEDMPLDCNLFPCLEHCRIMCDTVVDPSSLVPFWGACRLKTLYLEDIRIRSSNREDGHEALLAVTSQALAQLPPLEKLDLFHVGFQLSREELATLAGLRAVDTLRTELIRTESAVNRARWHDLVAILAPDIKRLICTRQNIGYFPYNEGEGGSKPFAREEVPPLGALVCAISLDITEQQLANALGMRGLDSEKLDRLPSSLERLHIEIDPNRMHRLRLYEVLRVLLASYRTGRLPRLTKLELFFQRKGGDLGSLLYSYSHEFIDVWEDEERGLVGAEGYEFYGGCTLEHRAFDQECKRFGLEVRVSTDAPVGLRPDDGEAS